MTEIVRLRTQRAKNFVCQLFFSAGTPMLLGGDEFLRTQRGNNNAYCQDNDISWFDWTLRDRNRDFFEFVKKTIRFTRRYPALERRTFFSGKDTSGDQRPDIRWYGYDLDDPRWDDAELRVLAYQLDGAEADEERSPYLLFVILSADWNARTVRIPGPGEGRVWHRVVDTSCDAGDDFRPEGEEAPLTPADHYIVNPRSTVVLIAR
jgi:glycogen operon protein